jgi:multiple sugar transport system permease protein
VVPLSLSLGLLVWRMGANARAGAGDALIVEADTLAAGIRAVMLSASADTVAARGGVANGDSDAARLRNIMSALPPDRAVAFFRADAGWQRVATSDPAFLAGTVPGRTRLQLETTDHSFAGTVNGRITAVVPVRDADEWDILGAVLLQRTDADPSRWPAGPLAIALAATLIVAASARRIARTTAPLFAGPAAGIPRHGVDNSAARESATSIVGRVGTAFIIFVAFAAFVVLGTWNGEAHGLWAVSAFAGWAVVAGVGFSLVRSVARPLQLREAAHAWAFLAPSLLHLLVFSLGPIVFSLWLSFHEWDLLSTARPFVGIDNYRALAGDAEFLRSLRNTAVYVLFVPVGMVVALALALLVNRSIPGVHVLRAVFFLPYITSFVAISLVWRWMFQPDVGLLNGVLGWLGIPPQPWLSSPVTALPSLMLMSIWMYAGYMMVIFLAGLQSIPASLYESARIDGAGAWQRFLYITVPMLRPTTLFLLVTMVIFMFQVFTAVYVMTEGGPLHATDVIVYHIYRNAWEYLRMGYASAMAWVLFAVVFVITLVQFRWLGARTVQ